MVDGHVVSNGLHMLSSFAVRNYAAFSLLSYRSAKTRCLVSYAICKFELNFRVKVIFDNVFG